MVKNEHNFYNIGAKATEVLSKIYSKKNKVSPGKVLNETEIMILQIQKH